MTKCCSIEQLTIAFVQFEQKNMHKSISKENSSRERTVTLHRKTVPLTEWEQSNVEIKSKACNLPSDFSDKHHQQKNLFLSAIEDIFNNVQRRTNYIKVQKVTQIKEVRI